MSIVAEMLILCLRLSLSQQTAGKPALSAGGAQADKQTWWTQFCSQDGNAMERYRPRNVGYLIQSSIGKSYHNMRRSDIRAQTASVRLAQDDQLEISRQYVFFSRLSAALSRLESRPALFFLLFSFAFGSAISIVVPPLRGPDEIAHFLRIYSYAQGGLLPVTEINGRKGIFIESELHSQLSFFKDAGERFGQSRGQGLRYGDMMKASPHPRGTVDQGDQATKFLPFAGTEGYTPAAYAPYILAAAIGNLLKLDFPNMLL